MDAKGTDHAKGLTLEDLAVGQVYPSESYQLSPADVKAFASQFDPQPFHLDEEAAKGTFFGGLVASGWHTAAITMRLLVSSLHIKGGLVGAGGDITWLRPTKPNDTLRTETEVMSIHPSRSKPDQGSVILRTTTKNQDGKSLQILTCRIVVPRRSSVEAK